jgi:ribosome maturation factor RimP
MTLVDSVTEAVAPVVSSLGVELVDVEHLGGVLRLVVDEPGGIGLDRIAEVTRAASRALDLADPLPGRYTLEVSSPGLERPLRTPAQFARAVGQKVAVRARPTFEGERRITGVLVDATDEQVVVRTDAGDEVTVPYGEVDRARTVFEYGPAPKPGKVGSRPKAKDGARPRRSGAAGEEAIAPGAAEATAGGGRGAGADEGQAGR